MSRPRKKIRVHKSMTWSDVSALMERIAKAADRDAHNQAKLAAMHRQLAYDLRELLRGKLIAI